MIHTMETQSLVDMTGREIHEERAKGLVEEIAEMERLFLKDLYGFMKKRDTPIERIPNLGFKQIDLYVMFKTVRDLGGYHQVTSQQLWKQVYNTLGGNPRSTSAATCTRRHYEKLLLPYECHVKGIPVNILPHHQPKPFHYASYGKDDGGVQMPAKRKLLSPPLHQNPLASPSDSRHLSAFPLPLHYPRFYHPGHAVLRPPFPAPPSAVLTPHNPTAPQPQFSFAPYHLSPTEAVNQARPLEHLRFLAERYKSSSGLSEPLNLSVKAPKRHSNSSPASSFAPPSSNKNPKFLNKPSPLYSLHCPSRGERCETQEGEAGLEDASSYQEKPRETFVVNVQAVTASGSPACDSAAAHNPPGSPRTDFPMREEREGSPDARGLNLSHMLPSVPRENAKGEMEIEMPLSVFHKWLRLCRSSGVMHGGKQLPATKDPRNCPDADDAPPTNLTFHTNPQRWSSVAEDLRPRQRNLPSPPTHTQTAAPHDLSQSPFAGPRPSGGIQKHAAGRDVYPFERPDISKAYGARLPNYWDAYNQESRVKRDSAQQKFAAPGGYERTDAAAPPAVLMLNPGSSSLLHLTSEEVMKLKKIISSSS